MIIAQIRNVCGNNENEIGKNYPLYISPDIFEYYYKSPYVFEKSFSDFYADLNKKCNVLHRKALIKQFLKLSI